MVRWYGKLIGALIGFMVFGGPISLLIGLFIGHLYDRGYFRRSTRRFNFGGNVHETQTTFFNCSFLVMGYLAKSDGRISENEIQVARQVMAQMGLSPKLKQEAIDLFNRGKQPNFDLDATLTTLKQSCWRHPSLLRMFIEIQLQIARADGQYISGAKRHAFQRICQQLGLAGFNFEGFQQQSGYRQNDQGSRSYHSPIDQLEKAYKTLGITAKATDAEVKKAYRRLMSQHHPDRLIAKGLPQEMIKLATQKTQEIKSAYEQICQARKNR